MFFWGGGFGEKTLKTQKPYA